MLEIQIYYMYCAIHFHSFQFYASQSAASSWNDFCGWRTFLTFLQSIHLHSNATLHSSKFWKTKIWSASSDFFTPEVYTCTHTIVHRQMHKNRHANKQTFTGGQTAGQLNVRLADAPSHLTYLMFICLPYLVNIEHMTTSIMIQPNVTNRWDA